MRIASIAALAFAVFVSGCTEASRSPVSPQTISIPVQLQAAQAGEDRHAALSHEGNSKNSGTHLTGAEEVPPRDTNAQGQAIFQLSKDGGSLSYKLNVANIENVTQAHIHLAPLGSNGGIVVWLYPAAPPAQLIPGRTQGTLGEGVITAANLVNALEGQPLSELLTAMQAGNAYVNVHTSQFPGGEIRGQVD